MFNPKLQAEILKRCEASSRGGKEAEAYKDFYKPETSGSSHRFDNRFNLNFSYRGNTPTHLSKGNVHIISSTNSSSSSSSASSMSRVTPNLTGFS